MKGESKKIGGVKRKRTCVRVHLGPPRRPGLSNRRGVYYMENEIRLISLIPYIDFLF
jgi:hypothetical protein